MDKREIENAKLGFKTIEDFFMQFGNDVHTRILLEEIFEGVMNAETIFVFGEQEQEGDQTGDSSPNRGDSHGEQQYHGPDPSESTDHLSKKDREDYL